MFRCLLLLAAIFATVSAFGPASLLRSVRPGLSTLSMLKVGEQAPDFSLQDKDGKTVKLSSFKGKKNVVVFFYPADSTPGCTVEACAFEKKAPEFEKKSTVVLGVSSGGPADKEKFIRTNKLNTISLLIDTGDVLRKSWEVPKALFGVLPGRVTYVINKQGVCQFVYDDLGNAAAHPEKALAAL